MSSETPTGNSVHPRSHQRTNGHPAIPACLSRLHRRSPSLHRRRTRQVLHPQHRLAHRLRGRPRMRTNPILPQPQRHPRRSSTLHQRSSHPTPHLGRRKHLIHPPTTIENHKEPSISLKSGALVTSHPAFRIPKRFRVGQASNYGMLNGDGWRRGKSTVSTSTSREPKRKTAQLVWCSLTGRRPLNLGSEQRSV